MSSHNSFVNASQSSNTVSASASEVRSRPRRLVSFMDDDDHTNNNYSYHDDSQTFSSGLSTFASSELGTTRSRGATPSPLSSRGASPLPMRHPSRATESLDRGGLHETVPSGWDRSSKTSSSRGAADFLDSSWSSLQSLASSVLGSDLGRETSNSTTTHARRKPSRSDVYIRSAPRSTPSAWGPSGRSTPEIGVGTREERQAFVQAKKREALLLADTGPISSRHLLHKRRDSSEYLDQGPDPEQDEDALAYIHHVQATDSITGVTIKYGCQPAVFRKANGFWPSDSIQSRKTVLLPVDACSVKGRPVRPRESVDLLSNDPHESPEDTNGSSIAPVTVSVIAPSPDRKTFSSASESEGSRTWQHESWVEIDGMSAAVEIGRVPRRALGFFPRTRRKSIPYADAEPSAGSSRDTTRAPSPPGQSQSPSPQDVLPGTRPRGDQPKPTNAHPPRPRHLRQRSSLQLSGTGVGTLDRTSTGPGPAWDGLSRFFAQHMPTLAPPLPPPNFRRSSFESVSTVTSNASTGLENISGALEGWVRKVTTRAKGGITELQQGTPNQQTSRGIRGSGDLIELDDAASINGRKSPALVGIPREPDRQGASSSSSSFRFTSPSATSRTRAPGFGLGSAAAYSQRLKDD